MNPEIKIIVKPFLKWAGGKGQLIPAISDNLPKNLDKIKNLTYVEPFIGSGAVMFWFLQNFPNVKKAVINDINPDLTKAYTCIKKDPATLIKLLKKIQKNYYALEDEESKKNYFLQMREKFNERKLEDLKNTAYLIFLNKTCFNGLYRVNSKGLFNVPFGKYVKPRICDEQNILAISNLLQKVIILNGDYSKTLEYAAKNSFFYFDPPYKPISKTSSFNSYASLTFDDREQERLVAFCKILDSKGYQWMLSNSDLKNVNTEDNYFDDLYKNHHIKRVKAKRSINSDSAKRGEIYELLVANYAFPKESELPN